MQCDYEDSHLDDFDSFFMKNPSLSRLGSFFTKILWTPSVHENYFLITFFRSRTDFGVTSINSSSFIISIAFSMFNLYDAAR